MCDGPSDPAERLREQKERVETLQSRTEDVDVERDLKQIQAEIEAKIEQANDPERPDLRIMDVEMIRKDINEAEHTMKRKQGDDVREREIDWDDRNQGIGGR